MSKGKSPKQISNALNLNLRAFKVNCALLLDEVKPLVARLRQSGDSQLAKRIEVFADRWHIYERIFEHRHANLSSAIKEIPTPKRPKRAGAKDDRPAPGGTA